MIVIFDLDGTIADNEHRRHLVADGHTDWDTFYENCGQDLPVWSVITIMRLLWAVGDTIVILSGRSDVVRIKTKRWLKRYDVPYHLLMMRPKGDSTPDEELKKEWLSGYDKTEIRCVFDDRQKVVDMWRAEGLTCLQVAPGDF